MSNGGKGDSSRPLSVPWEQYASDFDRIFGKPQKLSNPDPEPYDPEPLADAEQDLKSIESPMRPSYERRKYER